MIKKPTSTKSIQIKAEKALKSAVAKLIVERARIGDCLIVWRGGKVVWIPAKDLLRKNQSQKRKPRPVKKKT